MKKEEISNKCILQENDNGKRKHDLTFEGKTNCRACDKFCDLLTRLNVIITRFIVLGVALLR